MCSTKRVEAANSNIFVHLIFFCNNFIFNIFPHHKKLVSNPKYCSNLNSSIVKIKFDNESIPIRLVSLTSFRIKDN